jgi:hypothetical protein
VVSALQKYEAVQPLLLTADLIEWSSKAPLGYAIRWVTKKNVNHTSGVIVMNLADTKYQRRYIGEALAKGFQLSYLSKRIKCYKGKVYWLRLKEEFDKYRKLIALEALLLEGRPYGYKDLFKNISKPVKVNAKQVICSESWQIPLIKIGLLSPDFNDGLALRPGEFGRTGLYHEPIEIYSC